MTIEIWGWLVDIGPGRLFNRFIHLYVLIISLVSREN
jgi:hypothetical protein